MSSRSLTKTYYWQDLSAHHKTLSGETSLKDLLRSDPDRFLRFNIQFNGLTFDFSRHFATEDTIDLLCTLATNSDLDGKRRALFSGQKINSTEDRAVLHPALRGSTDPELQIDGENVASFVKQGLEQIKNLSEQIRQDPQIRDVVNIGIGGSDLGPRAVCEALKPLQDGPNIHFISDIDGGALLELFKTLTPDNTLFIISSKTFTTLETLSNARSAKDWLERTLGPEGAARRLVAVTANEQAAQEFVITGEHIAPLRSWIGGRYSLWSGIGLSIAVGLGFDGFNQLLAGARDMDKHFLEAPLSKNMPVMMAMLGIWARNFQGYDAHAVLPYAHSLHVLPAYVQQLDMESNGKRVSRTGQDIDYHTGPLVFGGPGTPSQHAFLQLFHQGSKIVPCDFIAALHPFEELGDHHDKLLANMVAQAEALAFGRNAPDRPHHHFPGNRPSSILLLERLDPYHMGMLCALYEHKIFVQGVVWNINSFDQWGVELGKELARDILQNKPSDAPEDDPVRTSIIDRIRARHTPNQAG